MLRSNIIRRSDSPWASAIVPVGKPDGPVRICIAYRPLNSTFYKFYLCITIPDAYPLKHIDEMIKAFRGAHYFSTLDLLSGYWQVPMHPESIKYCVYVVFSPI